MDHRINTIIPLLKSQDHFDITSRENSIKLSEKRFKYLWKWENASMNMHALRCEAKRFANYIKPQPMQYTT